ncbi:MAG TPA: hypothetical protein VEK57_28470 [Thermoanaerobaculia bacterium]|nr:hypothetical protein [Thermoanaerobaculia bacterium]
MTPARRETVLSAAFALWGLAVAIALVTFWTRPAPLDQLPGAAKALGFDAHGPFRWIAGLMLLPIVFPLVLRPVTRLLATGETWARNAAVVAPLVMLWMAVLRRSALWAFVPCAILLALCVVLRHRDLRFTRRDAVLVPVFLTTLLGLIDATPWLPAESAVCVAALLVFALRVAVTFIASPVAPALAFVAAPLGLVLQTGFFARDQRYFGWHALALVVVTPFVLRFLLRDGRRATALLVFLIYPLALYSYSNALSLATAEGKPRANFFEDGHSLAPASEYLRGELPYRDILPAHGLAEDGLFDLLAMKGGGVNIGARTKARQVAGTLVAPALYALAFAVTGSAEAAFFAVLLGFLTGAFRGNLRLLAPIATLACIAAAVRRRRPRLFAYAGAGSVLAGITSLDFGAYTFATLVIAVVRARDRKVALRYAAIGIAAAVIPLAIGLAAFGILDDFVRGTFVETLAAGPAYTMNFFTPPEAMAKVPAFPDVLVALLDRDVFLYLFWCAVTVFVGVTITRRAKRRLEPLVLLGVWIVLTGISYAERHHLYFSIVASVVVTAAILLLLRRRSVLAVPAIIAAVVLAAPTTHLGVLGWMRQARGPVDAAWVEIPDVPRARGALFHESDARFVAGVRKYLSLSLAPDETFFDFTNSSILYYLLRRDCPIRWYEVAFYETEELQREVIRRIEKNPKVRAVLVPVTPHARFAVDGIPNAERAPLVWAYLQENFSPDFAEGDVVFWRRR